MSGIEKKRVLFFFFLFFVFFVHSSLLKDGLERIRVDAAVLEESADVVALQALLVGPEVCRRPEVVAVLALAAEAHVGDSAVLEGDQLGALIVLRGDRDIRRDDCGLDDWLCLLCGLLGLLYRRSHGRRSHNRRSHSRRIRRSHNNRRGREAASLSLLRSLLGKTPSLHCRLVLRGQNALRLLRAGSRDHRVAVVRCFCRVCLSNRCGRRILGMRLDPGRLECLPLLVVGLLVLGDEGQMHTLLLRVCRLVLLIVALVLSEHLLREVAVSRGLALTIARRLLHLAALGELDLDDRTCHRAAGLEANLRVDERALLEKLLDGHRGDRHL